MDIPPIFLDEITIFIHMSHGKLHQICVTSPCPHGKTPKKKQFLPDDIFAMGKFLGDLNRASTAPRLPRFDGFWRPRLLGRPAGQLGDRLESWLLSSLWLGQNSFGKVMEQMAHLWWIYY